jgi:hypothetical protein
MDFKGDKICSMPSFRGEVKPSVPCCRFTACKRTLRAWKDACRQNSAAVFLTRVSPASLLDVHGGFTTLMVESGWLEPGDRGADNPHCNIPNCRETHKGGQGPTLGCSTIDYDDEYSTLQVFRFELTCHDLFDVGGPVWKHLWCIKRKIFWMSFGWVQIPLEAWLYVHVFLGCVVLWRLRPCNGPNPPNKRIL